jgi:hypothetical protein
MDWPDSTKRRSLRSIAMVLDYKKQRPWAENLSIVLQVGLTMAGCIVFCFFVGRYLDRLLSSGGIMTVLGTLFGIIGGGVVCYRQIMETFQDRSDSDSGAEHGND